MYDLLVDETNTYIVDLILLVLFKFIKCYYNFFFFFLFLFLCLAVLFYFLFSPNESMFLLGLCFMLYYVLF